MSAYCPNCPCESCRREKEARREPAPPEHPEYRGFVECTRCHGIIGGNWSTGGCTCHLYPEGRERGGGW